MGYCPWGPKESDTAERLTHTSGFRAVASVLKRACGVQPMEETRGMCWEYNQPDDT